MTVTTIKNIQATLVFGGLVIAGAIAAFLRWRPPSWVVAVLSAVIGLGVGVLVGAALANRRARESMAQTGFRVVEYRMDYVLEADVRRHLCTREFTLRATQDGSSLFVFEYTWSGQGEISTKVPAKVPYRLLDDSRSDHEIYRRTIIGMNRAYARGEEVTVAVTQHLEDRVGDFSHFLSKIVSHPIRNATLCIEFPPAMADEPVPTATLCKPNKATYWVDEKDLTPQLKRQGTKHVLALEDPPRGKMIRVTWPWVGDY